MVRGLSALWRSCSVGPTQVSRTRCPRNRTFAAGREAYIQYNLSSEVKMKNIYNFLDNL